MPMAFPIKHVDFPIRQILYLWSSLLDEYYVCPWSFSLSMWSSLLDKYYAYGLPYWMNITPMVFPIKHMVFPNRQIVYLWSFPSSMWSSLFIVFAKSLYLC